MHVSFLYLPLVLCIFVGKPTCPQPLLPPSAQLFIIVPGTWSSTTGWHSTGGDFFTALESALKNTPAHIVTFWWSGANCYKDREKAAHNLARLVASYPSHIKKIIIAHSHGTNVVLLAADVLAQAYPHRLIDIVYAFAAPVEHTTYIPNMQIIQRLYHFFSFSDYIQVAWGLFGRLFDTHERISNILVTINHQEPGHTDIHAPCIARYLPCFPELLQDQGFDGTHPARIDFFDDKPPIYSFNSDFAQQLALDAYILTSLPYLSVAPERTYVHAP